jgi:hypothetical protein
MKGPRIRKQRELIDFSRDDELERLQENISRENRLTTIFLLINNLSTTIVVTFWDNLPCPWIDYYTMYKADDHGNNFGSII